ncbi:MAG: transglycosylase SLT domain-containing protein [Bdellovibrionales bacterium]|nr:transglycosylase SLT domain-containing protein [Bdellovibrionales bacterium]
MTLFLLISTLSLFTACGFETDEFEALNSSLNETPTGASAEGDIEEGPTIEDIAQDENVEWPGFDWDGKNDDSIKWNEYTLTSIESVGQKLIEKRPSDILSFCPNYDNLNVSGKRMFWISLLAAMARFESSFHPETSYQESFTDSSGQRVVSRGLLQLSIESSLGYRCPLDSAQDLHDPQKNLDCSVRIMNRWIDRDGLITGKNSSGSWRGGARYWSVLRKESTLSAIRRTTRGNEVCQ